MGQRSWRLVVVVASCVVAMAAVPGQVAARSDVSDRRGSQAPDRPNIVLVLVDDMRADELRFLPRTRRLVGDRGVTFSNAISPHPLCCPARASLLTGQFGQNHGVKDNFPPFGGYQALRGKDDTIGRWLRRTGYRTAFVGKYLNEYREAHGRQRGWSRWQPLVDRLYHYERPVFFGQRKPDPGYVTREVGRRTLAFVDDAGRDPFFLFVSHPAPHEAPDVDDRVPGGWAPPVAEPRYADSYDRLHPGVLRKPSYDERRVGDLPPDLRFPRPTTSLVKALARGRARALRSVDDTVAALVRRLRSAGVLDETYVVVTSDNGFLLGEHRAVGKNYLYDEALDVPLLIRGPGLTAGVTDRTPVSLVDLAPTFVAWAGVAPGRRLDGLPLSQAAERDTILIQTGTERRGTGGWAYRGVTTPRYLYAYRVARPGQGLLFDRASDPYALRNRYDDPRYAAVRSELQERTRTLGRCGGAASCNRAFGAAPEPG